MRVHDLLATLLQDHLGSLNSFVLVNDRPVDGVSSKDGCLRLAQLPFVSAQKTSTTPLSTFQLKADITFEAHGLVDALRKLEHHFRAMQTMSQDMPSSRNPGLAYQGKVLVKPFVFKLKRKQAKNVLKRYQKTAKK